ncbi:coiled-coil protein required for normal flagellar motility [Strigomonas culicis]|uniref:Coiled-coil protein required for normal flagellar motility n=1 Tax=Strigomonas culicis TaxID=28005 RepID=S9TSS7_9TRYP|nr:coiled-coil protein required for normal flagellar motility [Strigomonas culicis]|eukprot:EPY19558.1 coiled-coil protein required for normal flagellar motility [Strigomonas culicis]
MAAEEARLQPRIRGLQEEINTMGEDMKQLVILYESLLEKQKETKKSEAACKDEILNFTSTLAHAKQLLHNVDREPDRVRKHIEIVMHSLIGAQKELASVEEHIVAQDETISKLELKQANRDGEVKKAKAALKKLQEEIETKRKTLATLNTSLEVEVETRQTFQERLTELERLVKATKISATQETDGVERIQREKEKAAREFGLTEQATDKILFEQQSLKEQLLLVGKDIDNVERSIVDTERRIVEAKKDVEVRTKKLLSEQSREKEFTAKANRVLEEIHEAEDMLEVKRKQEDVKRRELAAMATKHQNANRESSREAGRVVLARNEHRVKEMYFREITRRHEELENRLTALLELFHTVKRERGQKAAQIQAITQKMTEVAEKTKILENELEVLLRESALKEHELAKKQRQTHDLTQTCLLLRLEKSKQCKTLECSTEKEQAIKADVRRLNADVAMVEDTMTNLRHMYETAVEGRNQSGVQLIDRNDELALLVEKVKTQDLALHQGVALTSARSEEVRRLKIKLSDLQRELEICQKTLPKVQQMEEELARLNEEIDDERWKMEVVERDLTDPSNLQRYRHIETVLPLSVAIETTLNAAAAKASPTPGAADTAGDTNVSAATAAEAGATAAAADNAEEANKIMVGLGPSEEHIRLQARCQDLESRVNAINEKLREKELILAEVTELSERAGMQAEAGREHTLNLAKNVNQCQNGIRTKTRQIMATISELSLFQSSSIQLQQEVQHLEEIVAQAENRLAAGEAPFVEAEEEYEKEKDRDRRYAELIQKNREKLSNTTQGVKMTTAEPRPNAYIPDDELIAVPRPYGTFGAFKPTTLSLRYRTNTSIPKAVMSTAHPVASASRKEDTHSQRKTQQEAVSSGRSQIRLSERSETPPPKTHK